MKKTLILAVLAAVASGALLAGCGPSKTTDAGEISDLKRVAGNGSIDVYVVKIEGNDYIVAVCGYGVSICPKSRAG